MLHSWKQRFVNTCAGQWSFAALVRFFKQSGLDFVILGNLLYATFS